MHLLGRFSLRWHFAKKKEIIVKNIFNHRVLAQYTSPNDADILTIVEKTA